MRPQPSPLVDAVVAAVVLLDVLGFAVGRALRARRREQRDRATTP